MATYELTVVLPTNKEKQSLDRVKKVLETADAKVTKTDEWGKRTLAYPIRKQTEAVYYAMVVEMDTDKTNAVNRVLENDDDILRHMIVVARREQKVETKTEAKKEKKAEKTEKVENAEKKEVKSEKKPAKAASKAKGKSSKK